MPYYRIILKLEKEPTKTFVTEFPDRDIDIVASMFERRAREKYGAGRIEIFDCSMVPLKTVGKTLPQPDKFIPVPDNTFGLEDVDIPTAKNKSRREMSNKPSTTLGERNGLQK